MYVCVCVCMCVCLFVCLFVCMFVCVMLENAIISRATHKRAITCGIVMLRNVCMAGHWSLGLCVYAHSHAGETATNG